MAVTVLLLGGLASFANNSATAQQVSREQDIGTLRLGQRVRVDDGTCPAGQVKEISGTKMTPAGVARTAKCVPRAGANTNPTK
jgi:phosphosulfolactate phosphohydrolase-like enzyme